MTILLCKMKTTAKNKSGVLERRFSIFRNGDGNDRMSMYSWIYGKP